MNALAPNLFVNGTTSFRETDCTSKDLKEGFFNTKALVSAMGDETFASLRGPRKTGFYAARLCSVLEHTVDGVAYVGWFLPSMNELNRMYETLFMSGIGEHVTKKQETDQHLSLIQRTDGFGESGMAAVNMRFLFF